MITPINSPHAPGRYPPSRASAPRSRSPIPEPRLHPSIKAEKSRKTRSHFSKAPANPIPTADSAGNLSDVAGRPAILKGAPS